MELSAKLKIYVMKNYPIYIGKRKENQFIQMVQKIGNLNKNAGQGSSSVPNTMLDEIINLIPSINACSWNHYDCDGVTAFAIRFKNDFTNMIKIDGEIYKGVVFGAPRRHLSKYYKLRW